MAYLYILQSKKTGQYYVGSTTDIKRRLKQHFSKTHPTSKRLFPFKLVFQQECVDVDVARRIERRIKKLKRRDYIDKIIADGQIKMRAHSSVGESN